VNATVSVYPQHIGKARLAALAAFAVVAVTGAVAYASGLVWIMLACAVATAFQPRAWYLYGVAGLVAPLVGVLLEGGSVAPFFFMFLAGVASSAAVRVFSVRRTTVDARMKGLTSIAALALFVAALPMYAKAKVAWANVQTQRFCDSVRPGDQVAGLEDRARKLGLRTLMGRASADGQLPPGLLTWEGWAFARYFCNVEHDNSRVTKRERYFLD